jgi:hypothetical protein
MDLQSARAAIWAQECEIYQGRGAGSLSSYIDMLAPGYLAWPPHQPAPIDGAALAKRPMAALENLHMQLVDFTLNGETAIIYYQTHRTMLPDGTPVDEHYDVIHVWVTENGVWKILAGMARATPVL